MGERTPIAVIDAPASGRMAVAEALTNLAAAPVESLSRVKLSANWMAAAGSPGEDAALFDTVKAVALDLCPRLGVGIPVGKDSMSMRTTWEEGGQAEGRRRPALARRVRVRSLPRRATDLDAPAAHGPGRDRPRLRGPRRRAEAPRRVDPGPGLRPDGERGAGPRRPRADQGPLRGPRRAARGLARPRLPRPVRRRALRDARRDGVRRAHRGDDRRVRARGPRGRHRAPPRRALQRGAGRGAAVADGRPGPRPRDPRPARPPRPRPRRARETTTRCGSPAVTERSSPSRAPPCTGCGPRPPGGCRRCATTPSRPARSTTGSSTPAIPASRPLLTFDPGRGRRRSFRGPRRAAAPGHPARAGRERPGRDGGRVRPRRLRGRSTST